MANVYAIKTGNWSDPTVWNTGALPTSADDVFANGFTVTIDQTVNVLSIRTTAASPAIAGGGFLLNSSIIVTLSGSGIIAGSSNCVTYSQSTGTSTINGTVRGSATTANIYGILYSGSANLNINGAVTSGPTVNAFAYPIAKTGSGILTVVGNVTAIGGVNAGTAIYNSGTGTVNITGNIYATNGTGYGHGLQNVAICTINVTGDIYGGNVNPGNSFGLYNTGASTINITGNLYSSTINSSVFSNAAGYISIIGSLNASNGSSAFQSGNASAINLLSGPFICATYGTYPFQCFRMHLIPSVSTYFEFRDETTNGALFPGAIAPPTRLISPASASDAPAQSDVRLGVVYANSSQTGTCAIPNTGSVAYGIPVDNTVGTAVINAEDIWKIPLSSISTSGSIGLRVKNVSTVQITGAQIAAYNG
jgi:hypothetical protein